MSVNKKIKRALISVFNKDGIDDIVLKMKALGIEIISTGGTFDYITKLGVEVTKVEDITSYPSILGGRVKTLHPKVFGGILARRDNATDNEHLKLYNIPEIDVVIVDLYPFEQTVKETSDESAIIEKIDIGGISLIRAAAKNYKDVVIVPSANEYKMLLDVLENKNGETTLEERKKFAAYSFAVSSNYDTAIFNYFNSDNSIEQFRSSKSHFNALRYGENPHQLGAFYGDLEEVFSQLHGKAISYNNLLDLDAAINLINEFDETTFAVLKHNNACGLASRPKLIDAWKGALAGDPISAFGGVLITNTKVDLETAEEINKLFFEIILAPDYDDSALTVLKKKKNRIILKKNRYDLTKKQFRSLLNGVIVQDRDLKTEEVNDMETVTNISPKENQKEDLTFANKIVKHSKSNAIVLAKNKQLLASGVGQTSRVDALKQSIEKAMSFEQNLENAVMASDAFFPFADSVEIAHKAGITAVIQPGGSIKDKDSIEYCNKENIAMVFTGNRHFKH